LVVLLMMMLMMIVIFFSFSRKRMSWTISPTCQQGRRLPRSETHFTHGLAYHKTSREQGENLIFSSENAISCAMTSDCSHQRLQQHREEQVIRTSTRRMFQCVVVIVSCPLLVSHMRVGRRWRRRNRGKCFREQDEQQGRWLRLHIP